MGSVIEGGRVLYEASNKARSVVVLKMLMMLMLMRMLMIMAITIGSCRWCATGMGRRLRDSEEGKRERRARQGGERANAMI